jgi:hypothetical protein
MRNHYDWRWVEEQTERTAGVWDGCDRLLPAGGVRFTSRQQDERESAYDAAMAAVEIELEKFSSSEQESSSVRAEVIRAFGLFAARALDLAPDAIEILTDDFMPVGTGLAQWARRFDPDLGMPDIIQACRNAWTACGLQPLLGEPVRLTPAILGYSMLYPYSDNYLDEECISVTAKLAFSQRFRQLLRGETLLAENNRELAIRELIQLIEHQFSRKEFPDVYTCLLAIHRAQEHSVQQLRTSEHFSTPETLRLSCRKGGSSVLADACLARGCMSEQEARFAFEWGVLLQLGDDLQDVREDLHRGSMTLFSHPAGRGEYLDGRTLQLLSFADHVGRQMEQLPNGTETLKNLLKMSWRSLIIRAVADSEEFFSPAFAREAQKCSPFRFDFLRSRQQRIASRHGLYARLFEAFIEGSPDGAMSGLPAPQRGEDWAFQPYVETTVPVGVLK